ncbi:hypothetical protein GQ600_7532 [Phytophthora cactorum]|nr:hypothetical protein GQ600_7532 [Phytophthora cactorum]
MASSNTEEKKEDGAQEKGRRRRSSPREEEDGADVDADELYYVPAFKAQYNTWADLETCLQEYMENTRRRL